MSSKNSKDIVKAEEDSKDIVSKERKEWVEGKPVEKCLILPFSNPMLPFSKFPLMK
jgi:hypothetical protein